MKPLHLFLAAALLVPLAACNDDPAEGKAHASVGKAQDIAAGAPAGAVAFPFDQKESKVEFVGAKVSAKHEGSFKTFAGTVHLAEKDPAKSSVVVEIETDSIVADSDRLTGHLKSEDFFDVKKFPKAKFTSSKVTTGGANGASHTVTGNLELHGVTKSITFPANIKVTDGGVDVDAEFAINRKDFGIVYAGMQDDLIKDDVLIKLTIRAKNAKS